MAHCSMCYSDLLRGVESASTLPGRRATPRRGPRGASGVPDAAVSNQRRWARRDFIEVEEPLDRAATEAATRLVLTPPSHDGTGGSTAARRIGKSASGTRVHRISRRRVPQRGMLSYGRSTSSTSLRGPDGMRTFPPGGAGATPFQRTRICSPRSHTPRSTVRPFKAHRRRGHRGERPGDSRLHVRHG
jgi:hypothetical protein